jgi:hypothetical protein
MGGVIGELMVRKIIDATMTMRDKARVGEEKGLKYSSRVLLRENWQIEGRIRKKQGSVALT